MWGSCSQPCWNRQEWGQDQIQWLWYGSAYRPLMQVLHKHRIKCFCPSKNHGLLLCSEKREWKDIERPADGQSTPAAPFWQLGVCWQWWSTWDMTWEITLSSLPGMNHHSWSSNSPALLLAKCVRELQMSRAEVQPRGFSSVFLMKGAEVRQKLKNPAPSLGKHVSCSLFFSSVLVACFRCCCFVL